MPCFYPLQANFSVSDFGKKKISFSTAKAELFYRKGLVVSDDFSMSLPCGRCIGCRLERSRQWAVRIMHESQMYDFNCFITLTFDDEHLLKECPTGSLSKRHVQLFMKRLRQSTEREVRFFACGEYGENFERPHYHFCLFNYNFLDKELHSIKNDNRYYCSNFLSKLWPFGFNIISDLTFDSAAYVARYCTKKITGDKAEEHYRGRQPEFALMSRKPGIGYRWLEKYGKTDVWTHDEVVIDGHKCKPPRFYDKKLEALDPVKFASFKEKRRELAKQRESEHSHDRLKVKEKCVSARFKRLAREYENV